MSKYLSCVVVVLTGIACGGTTDTGGNGSSGGASDGGSNSAGHGGSGTAGKSSGGSVSTGGGGSGSGGSGTGGVVSGGATTGGAGGGTFDPRCPAHIPNGPCDASDNGLKCEYDNFTGCLCYTSQPGTFGLCQKVDPTCTSAGGAGSAAPPPAAGAGGVSAKVALPPHEVCSCSAQTWACTFGF